MAKKAKRKNPNAAKKAKRKNPNATKKAKQKHPFTNLIMRIIYDPKVAEALEKDPNFTQHLGKHLESHEVFKLTKDQANALVGKSSDAINREIEKEFQDRQELGEMVRVRPPWPVNHMILR